MGEERRVNLASSDFLKHLHLGRTVSKRVEKEFFHTLNWCRDHIGSKKTKSKLQRHNEEENTMQIRHVRSAVNFLTYFCPLKNRKKRKVLYILVKICGRKESECVC